MIALALAAVVVAMPLKSAPANCAAPQVKTLSPGAPPQARKLADLPDAMEIRAVLRSVGGCQYQDVMRFSVSRPGPMQPPMTLVPTGGAVERAEPTGEGR